MTRMSWRVIPRLSLEDRFWSDPYHFLHVTHWMGLSEMDMNRWRLLILVSAAFTCFGFTVSVAINTCWKSAFDSRFSDNNVSSVWSIRNRFTSCIFGIVLFGVTAADSMVCFSLYSSAQNWKLSFALTRFRIAWKRFARRNCSLYIEMGCTIHRRWSAIAARSLLTVMSIVKTNQPCSIS